MNFLRNFLHILHVCSAVDTKYTYSKCNQTSTFKYNSNPRVIQGLVHTAKSLNFKCINYKKAVKTNIQCKTATKNYMPLANIF